MGFSYGDFPILNNINLDLEGSQLVSIVGPNGVGKSTLVGCICGLLQPQRGSIEVNNVPLGDYRNRDLAKIIGYVPCSAKDAFPLSVTDTVLMGKGPYNGWKTTDRDLKEVYSILRLLGIESLAMRNFDEVSAGQHQKIMLARGIIQNTEILILDEPTANLDIKHQLEVTRILSELVTERDMMIIMISHDLNIAAKYSDNMVMLSNGSIYAVGAPKEVLTKENIKAVYGVDSEIIESHGRPHIIMLDSEFDDVSEPLPPESFVSGRKVVEEHMERGTRVRDIIEEQS